MKEQKELPHLQWIDIRQECKPIGEQGYFGDCFFHTALNVVVKKFRQTQWSDKVKEEVAILQYLQQQLQDKIVHHLLIDQNVLMGFTLTYYQGKMWDKVIEDQNSIFRKSPIARVRIVLQLTQQMRKLQEVGVCHADLHCQNILIKVEEQQDIMNPLFQTKIIDFGNAFRLQQGKLVSYGLTGWTSLIPPQVQFKYYKDYNPLGLNAYQLGRNAFFFLFLKQFKTIEDANYLPIYELDELQEKYAQYPKQLHRWLCELLHYDISIRNQALFRNMTHLQDLTKELLINKQKNKEKQQKQ